jgi:hypothetical protein
MQRKKKFELFIIYSYIYNILDFKKLFLLDIIEFGKFKFSYKSKRFKNQKVFTYLQYIFLSFDNNFIVNINNIYN